MEVRVVCATNKQLEKEIKTGNFRQDLFYRINVITIELPSLQQRAGDLPVLVDYLLNKYAEKFGRSAPPLSKQTMRFLQKYSWPGNIRELENVIKRYVIVGREEAIASSLESDRELMFDADDVPVDGVIKLKEVTKQAVRQIERKIILKTLEVHRWNRQATARALSISYAALLYKMREAGVPPRRSSAKSKGSSPKLAKPRLASSVRLGTGPSAGAEQVH